MEITCQLLDLPDLALYRICSVITCPFDLLHFGNTCSRLRQISSASSLWQLLGFRCFRGLWVQLEEGSVEDSPREWLLDIMRKIIRTPRADTKTECVFPNGEKWIRKDSPKFRFLVGLLHMAYSFEKDAHPLVLGEKHGFFYDVGIYERCNPVMNFSTPVLNVDSDVAEELSNLSQAAERDLRLRKQPFKDKRYYISYDDSVYQENLYCLYSMENAFYLCPFLFPPREFVNLSDGAGLVQFFPCLGEILLKHLAKHNKLPNTSMMTIWEAIKLFCSILLSAVTKEIVKMTERPQHYQCILQDSLAICNQDIELAAQFDKLCTYCNLQIPYREVIAEFRSQVRCNSKRIFKIATVRENLGIRLIHEAQGTLFPDKPFENLVTRVNLTDCDLIGGDNSMQEMACAALISNHGVLVTWQLIGRARY